MNEINVFLINNTYKYECENLIKLYFKDASLKFYFDEEAHGDSFFSVSVSELRDKGEVRFVVFGNKFAREVSLAGKDEEWALLEALYDGLSGIFGPESWGMLTGVRPIKLIRELSDKGKEKAEIEEIFRSKFKVSKEKTAHAIRTFYNQKEILKDVGEDSVGFYISIPFCPSRCSYCSFVSGEIERMGELTGEYTRLLSLEIEKTARLIKEKGLKVDTVYVGGGTPTSLQEPELEAVLSAIEKNIGIEGLREFCVEAGRPDTITEGKLRLLKSFDVSRISINPQTLNPDVLKGIGRKHTIEDFYDKFSLARKLGFDNINTDLIAGLASDSVESFKRSVDGIIELDPENITVHTLTLKRAASLYRETGLYREKSAAEEMVDYSIDALIKSGFEPYYMYRQKNTVGSLENTGYSKKGKEGLYNIFIMDDSQSIFACGAGASTKTVLDGKVERSFNFKLPLEYIKNFDEVLKRKEETFKIFPERR